MKKVIMLAAILMLVCCGDAEATSELRQIEVPPIVEINLDDMTFTDAFRVQYRAKGEGHTFWWRNSEYTTNLAQITAIPDEFVVKHVEHDEIGHLGWVRNNDDPDDACKSNTLDDCGVCDGAGRIT